MKNVKFPLVYSLPNNSGVIVYPDSIETFSNIEVVGDFVYATYSGALNLTEAEKPYAGSWVIEVPAYLRRFDRCCNTPKQASLACDANPICQGMMNLALSRVREGIDLKSTSLPTLLGALVNIGKLTQAEADCIRLTPPRADELFKGS